VCGYDDVAPGTEDKRFIKVLKETAEWLPPISAKDTKDTNKIEQTVKKIWDAHQHQPESIWRDCIIEGRTYKEKKELARSDVLKALHAYAKQKPKPGDKIAWLQQQAANHKLLDIPAKD
jgi:hypothetical protein